MLKIPEWISFKRAVSSRLLTRVCGQCTQTPNEHLLNVTATNNFRCVSKSSRLTSRQVFFIRQSIPAGGQWDRVVRIPKTECEFRELSTGKKLPIIYLFTKDGCTLCDEAKEALKPYMHRFILEDVNITLPENEKWYEMYKYDIPVFHIYEEFLFKHRVDFDALERGLEKYKDGFDSSK
ncbi:uncharacterized protein LOC123566436 [Mercenaria mercenaria]|uniref:uncharacterized protein LOC123566436 n=1 Tax=Mercenaria mercenaria TaxID=6596 RepID=UPI00234E64B8|nr:uncharacterized protein LOC123566436 [Mercenaria mercenaria]